MNTYAKNALTKEESLYMKNSVLLDSDVIIWFLRGRVDIKEKLQKFFLEETLYTTPVSVAEIFAGLRPHESKMIKEFFNQLNISTITYDIGCMAGEYLNKYSKSHSLELGDALIAASVLTFNLKLWTLNTKHYPMLQSHDFI